MTAAHTTPQLSSKQNRFKGSLAGTLVRTLLVFTFIPLALMAGAAYLRTRALLQEQAANQSQNLLVTQLNTIDHEIEFKESRLSRLMDSGDFKILMELALHANPQSDEFRDIRNAVLKEFELLNAQESAPAFDHYLLLDKTGAIKISSNQSWEGKAVDAALINETLVENHSIAMNGLSPILRDEFILVTAIQYETRRGSTLGSIIGITEKDRLKDLFQPLHGLAPLATTYFVLSDGQVIVSDPDTGDFNLSSPDSVTQNEIDSALTDLIQNQKQQPQTLNVDSQDALTQIQWFPRIQSGVVLEVSTREIYSQLTSLVPFTGILILSALLATGLVLVVGTNRVIKPLRNLSDIARGFAEGDWSRRATVKSNDEVGLLASSFNDMADELGEIYRSLEQKIDERGRQIRTAAEVAQNITSLSSLDETFNKTVELVSQQFGFYQTSIFILDRNGRNLEFKKGFGPASKGLSEKKYKIGVGSTSIMGWVSANNQARVASDVTEDELHLKNELLPETRSEACVPISLGSLVIGLLDVQSVEPDAFSPETVVMLQTLASQLATAIQTAELTESSHVNLEELARLYRSSHLIAKATSEDAIFEASSKILQDAPYPILNFRLRDSQLELVSQSDAVGSPDLFKDAKPVSMNTQELEEFFSSGPVITSIDQLEVPSVLRIFAQKSKFESAAYIPVRKNENITSILLIGARKQTLSAGTIQPYTGLADLISTAFERTFEIQQTEKHLREVETLASIGEIISVSSDLRGFFDALHSIVRQIIGDYSFMVALYDEKSDTISIPYSQELGQFLSIDPFPLGEGLTSILLRTRQPLMLVEDTEKQAAELGAKIQGQAARSWMGAPMLIQNKPIGAIIIQDVENENAFTEDDLKFFVTLTSQVAGVINNVRLLDESQNRALQLETAAEIARDISGSLNIDELLIKAVNFIRERFNFYHASVFLIDLPGEFAVIRESTGDAGAQMKRAGYKIGIGSKSIVGFVSSKGELLVVNETTKDATYFANPLFPDTRAEAAIPLKVGERILGVLDVQSTKPYAFSEDNLRSLQILADQIAIAVINTELFSETQEHLSQHRLLHHITTTVASGTTLEEALESAVNGLQVTLGGDRISILLVDREKKNLEIKASMGYADEIKRVHIPIGSGITGWAASHKRPLRIKDVTTDSRYIQVSSNTRSELAIPLIYRNELLGVLNAESEHVDAYTENDEEMLGTLGGSLAAIIANARLLEQIRLQAERERVIYEVTSKIRRSTDIQSIMMTTTSELTRITGSRYTRLEVKPGKENGKEDS